MGTDIRIVRYNASLRNDWDAFVSRARQRNIIYFRDYMDYHGERMEDCSLLAYAGNRLKAVLPCEKTGSTASSHRGLTFGGWLTPEKHFDVFEMNKIFEQTADFFVSLGVNELIYKPIPWIYCTVPADEDRFVLSRTGTEIIKTELTSVIVCDKPNIMRYESRRLSEKAKSMGIRVVESEDLDEFMNILEMRLSEKYNSKPVHTYSEMRQLKNRFSNGIKLYTVISQEGSILGGTILYISDTAIKTQYIATTEEGRKFGALAMLIDEIRHQYSTSHRYIDLGSSSGDGVMGLNESLLNNKYGLGARPITVPTYRLEFRGDF